MKLKTLGFVFVIISVFLAFFNSTITGAVIFNDTTKFLNLFVVILFIIGILMIHKKVQTNETLEGRVAVYDDHRGNKLIHREDEHYFMTDFKHDFGEKGVVSLRDFRKEVENYRAMGEDGKEFLKIIRAEYLSDLVHLASSHNKEKAKIAKEFLRALDSDLVEDDGGDYGLDSQEKTEIKNSFKQWDGSLRSVPTEVIRKYGLESRRDGKHLKISQRDYEDNHVVAPLSPSDWRGGRNLAKEIIHMIEENKKKKKN